MECELLVQLRREVANERDAEFLKREKAKARIKELELKVGNLHQLLTASHTNYDKLAREKDQEIVALKHGPEGIWALKGEVMKLEEELKDLVTAGDALAFIVLRDLVKK